MIYYYKQIPHYLSKILRLYFTRFLMKEDTGCFRQIIAVIVSFFQLSSCNNELVRMSQVCKLNHLKILNLSNNNIEFMDGLKELKLLSWLGLANNKIKTIQQLNQCVHLEHLDLSGNFIQHLNDMSFLKNLKVHYHSMQIS